MKSKPARKGSTGSALAAAERTFGASPSLPLSQSANVTPGTVDHRRRLSGAFLIDIDYIEPDPDQPRKRIDPNYLDELTASVRRHGILQPISVRFNETSGKYRIIAGQCRFEAARRAEAKDVPCWVRTPTEEQVLLHQIIENWQRADMNPFDLADALAVLRDVNGFSQQELADQTGKSKGEISKLLSILDIDPDVQRIVREDVPGSITKRHLYPLSRLDVATQNRLVHRITDQQLTALDVERFVSRRAKKEAGKDLRGAQYQRRKFVTSRATVLFTFRSNQISDNDVLEAIHEVKRQIAKDAA